MRIPVFCSLIPTELLVSLGHELCFLDASECTRTGAPVCNCQLHENLCSYIKTLHDYFLSAHEKYDMIIVPAACDATKKLLGALKEKIPQDKLYLLDVPQNKGGAASRFFASELQKLVEKLDGKIK